MIVGYIWIDDVEATRQLTSTNMQSILLTFAMMAPPPVTVGPLQNAMDSSRIDARIS